MESQKDGSCTIQKPSFSKCLILFFTSVLDMGTTLEKALSIFVFYLRNIILLSKISPLFQKNFFEINSSIQKNHGNMMAGWYEIIKNSKVAALKRLKYLDDIIVNLTMFTLYLENVKISKKNSGNTAKTHVLFSLDGKTAYLNYLQIYARNILETSHTKITFLSNQRIDNAYIRRFKVDILVKNYKDNYEHFDCPTYTCSRQPTTKDWDKVSQYISDFEG